MNTHKSFTTALILLILCICLCYSASSQVIQDRYTITIGHSENGLSVVEDIEMTNTGNTNETSLMFWIQQGASTIEITNIDENKKLETTSSGNTYTSNLTSSQVSFEKDSTLHIRITYSLPASTDSFEKTLLYDTTSSMLTFNQRDLYLSTENTYSVLLYIPSEAPLNLTYIVIVFLLIIILIGSTLLLLKKQRKSVKKSIRESEELLKTKKTVLLSLLKDIEKQHRAKAISDDTYNKLKEEYKQITVEVMKKLDGLEK